MSQHCLFQKFFAERASMTRGKTILIDIFSHSNGRFLEEQDSEQFDKLFPSFTKQCIWAELYD